MLAVSPPIPGLSVEAIEDGARLRIRNDTAVEIEIHADTVQADDVVVPAGESRTLIDRRATSLDRDLSSKSPLPWSIHMMAGTQAVIVAGEFVAAPPASYGWWTATITLGVATAVLARRARRPNVLLAATGLITALASVLHVVGTTFAVESAPLWQTFLDAMGLGLLVWPLVVAAAVTALRGRAAGVLGVCVGAGLSVAFILPDVTEFHYAIVPFAGPVEVSRALVAVVLGMGGATAAAGAGALRALAARQQSKLTEPGDRSTS
ncbi:hypothetical protein [Mycolicibacterium goodii]|uniref:hypothetical protein n=1 Tax=Mycolicibacterium goodii TaxID=134601 RepID=UPI001BDD0298|nr:hypothetical protein [Mycolicibacterium goodii]MBU8829769.1 hypothetical protein [Mycolicibacterium goodii]